MVVGFRQQFNFKIRVRVKVRHEFLLVTVKVKVHGMNIANAEAVHKNMTMDKFGLAA